MRIFKIITNTSIAFLLLNISHHAYSNDDFDDISKLTEQWINIESQLGNARLTWDAQKYILDQQIKLYSDNQKALQTKIEEGNKNRSNVDNERLKVSEKQSLLESKQATIKTKTAIALHKMQVLLNRLPPPLQKQWSTELASIDLEKNNSSEALDNTLALLKMLYEFQGRIAVHEGKISVQANSESGSQEELLVSQVYFGVSHGWYINNNGERYGYGESTRNGWKWWHNEQVKQVFSSFDKSMIKNVIDIIENPKKAKIAALPVRIGGR